MKKLFFSLLIIAINLYSMDNQRREIVKKHIDTPNQLIEVWHESALDIAVSDESCFDLVPTLLGKGGMVTAETLKKTNLDSPQCINLLLSNLNHISPAIKKLMIDESGVLCWAGEYGSVCCAEELLKHGADVNVISETGLTPLHSCISLELTGLITVRNNADEKRKKIVLERIKNKEQLLKSLLFKYNANASKVDEFGRTPVTFAESIVNFFPNGFHQDFLNRAIVILKDHEKQKRELQTKN